MKSVKSKARRIAFFHLENWKNFRKVQIPLERRTFIVGPNASGKSNFLDAFRFLGDIVSVGGGFQEAVRKRGGVSSLRCLAAREYSDIVIEFGIGEEPGGDSWKYTLKFNQDNLRRPNVKQETVVGPGDKTILSRPDELDRSDPERLTQTFLEQVNVNREFREIGDFLKSIRYLHLVPQLIREPDRSVGRHNDPYGGDFLEQVARTPEKTRRARLRKILNALRVAVPQLSELILEQDKRGIWHLKGKYEHWRPQGAWQTEEQFSDGTLRLLGFLWAVLDGNGPLLLEEPELSLHPEVVMFLPQLLARVQRRTGRQVIMSTHSKDLLSDTGIGLDEVLLMTPGAEGTAVDLAASLKDARILLDHGQSMAEVVIPRTRPQDAAQLTLALDYGQ